MGAMLYSNFTEYTDDPADALLAIQARLVDETYDVENVVAQQIASVRDALSNTPDDDEYGVGDQYRQELEFLEGLATKPLPENEVREVSYIRAAFKFDECGLGNILDIRDIGDTQGAFVAAPVPQSRIDELLDGGKPTRKNSALLISSLNEILGRGECLFFPVYSDDALNPTEWCFVGNTVD